MRSPHPRTPPTEGNKVALRLHPKEGNWVEIASFVGRWGKACNDKRYSILLF
jgi:hypothetical protein